MSCCDAEMCLHWDGHGCPCDEFGIERPGPGADPLGQRSATYERGPAAVSAPTTDTAQEGHMSDLHAYRASAELAAALIEYQQEHRAFGEKITAWDLEHPGNELLWRRGPWSADQTPCGFADKHGDAPAGLSRCKERRFLIPKRGPAGAPWRDVLAWAGTGPSLDKVLRRFDVPPSADGPYRDDLSHRVAPTQWANCGADGVVVVNRYDLVREREEGGPEPKPLTRHLTPIPLSEFYTIKERAEAASAVSSAVPGEPANG
jgi:hypothetical protein